MLLFLTSTKTLITNLRWQSPWHPSLLCAVFDPGLRYWTSLLVRKPPGPFSHDFGPWVLDMKMANFPCPFIVWQSWILFLSPAVLFTLGGIETCKYANSCCIPNFRCILEAFRSLVCWNVSLICFITESNWGLMFSLKLWLEASIWYPGSAVKFKAGNSGNSFKWESRSFHWFQNVRITS